MRFGNFHLIGQYMFELESFLTLIWLWVNNIGLQFDYRCALYTYCLAGVILYQLPNHSDIHPFVSRWVVSVERCESRTLFDFRVGTIGRCTTKTVKEEK
jgi:hypothetical protein